eukprot:3937057-Rhodomonas_salina.2
MEQESKARVRRRARARALKSLLAAGVVCCGWWTPRRAVANLSVERARAGETARWRARERRGGKRSVLSGEQSRSLNGAPFKLGFRCRVEDSAHTFSVQLEEPWEGAGSRVKIAAGQGSRTKGRESGGRVAGWGIRRDVHGVEGPMVEVQRRELRVGFRVRVEGE